MRIAAVLLMVIAAALPVRPESQRGEPAIRTLSVAELQRVLVHAQGESDRSLAKELSTMELAERLSDSACERLKEDLRGNRSREALQVMADASAFLQLPAAEIPHRPAPDVATQRQILALTAEYVIRQAHVLPNLYATRLTVGFRNMARAVLLARGEGMARDWQPVQPVGRSSIVVTYRNGAEVEGKALRPNERNRPLVTTGEFGPILGMVLYDAAHASLRWAHWEQGSSGLEGVFAYAVPLPQSQYEPGYCCVRGQPVQQRSAYHGEIAVDPATGVIRRLTIETDGLAGGPLVWTGTMVRYGEVVLGGKTYICPLRTVSITQALPGKATNPAGMAPPGPGLDNGWLQTLLNDTVFENYHLFRASVRILP